MTRDLAVRAVFSGPFGGVARAVPGTIQAEDFDEGGEGVGYHDSDAVNSSGTSYRVGGVDIGRTASDYAVGWSNTGEWLAYMIDVAEEGRSRPILRVASGMAGGTAQLSFRGGGSSEIVAPATGGWQNRVGVAGTPVQLQAGVQLMHFVYAPARFELDWIRIESASLSLRGAASLAGSGEVGVRFSRALDPTSATRAANYAIPGVTVTAATLSPDPTGVLLRVSDTLDPTFTERVSGVQDTVCNQVPDGSEAVGQVLAQRRQDVGTPGNPGVPGVNFSGRAWDFDLLAGGTDMWNNQDGFHFIQERLTGEFDVRVGASRSRRSTAGPRVV